MTDDDTARRLGARCIAALEALDARISAFDVEWDGDQLVGFASRYPEIACVVLASPAANLLRRLHVNRDLYEDYGAGASDFLEYCDLGEILARAPQVTNVRARADVISLSGTSHDALEELSVDTTRLPALATCIFPALRRLDLRIQGEPVTLEQLTAALAPYQLTHLRLRGAGLEGLVMQLPAVPFSPQLSLTIDAEISNDMADRLLRSPGTLAALGALHLARKRQENRLVLVHCERGIPSATRDDYFATDARWLALQEAAYAAIDPRLRSWVWCTRNQYCCSGWIGFLPHGAALDLVEQDLLRACDERVAGSAAVYADWLEQRGHVTRAELVRSASQDDPHVAVRGARPGLAPSTLTEAAFVLGTAWSRTPGRGTGSTPSRAAPLHPSMIDEYVELFELDEHPLAPSKTREVTPEHFDDRVASFLRMMKGEPTLVLLEDGLHASHDTATFVPPIGTTRAALQIRDAWNDIFIVAETDRGYALLVWGTGA